MFEEALQYLLGLGHETIAIKLGLTNTERLLEALGNPQASFPSVQIAGTNGKGSTAHLLAAILHAAGIRAGLYTSPHLVRITERIRIAGHEISRADFARLTGRVRASAESLVAAGKLRTPPTFFEHLTAIALLAFEEARVQLAILETGLGGRLDATTTARAKVVALTPIALDHQEYLGETLSEIAAEKAAIIRPGVSALIAPQAPEALAVILRRCADCGVEPRLDECKVKVLGADESGRVRASFKTKEDFYENVLVGLRGRHQAINASLAISLAEALRERGFSIARSAIIEGLESARHAGRLELRQDEPRILFDGAHNPAGAQALRAFLDEFIKAPVTLIFGAMRDKDLSEMAATLFPVAQNLVLTAPSNPRAATLDTLSRLVPPGFDSSRIILAPSAREALAEARARTPPAGIICVTGSLYLVGEVERIAECGFEEKVGSSFSIRTPQSAIRNQTRHHPMATPNVAAPEVLATEEVYHGHVIDVSVDTVREQEVTYKREVVHHPGGAGVVAVFDDNTIALVRQYRHPTLRYVLELPAGRLAPPERPEECAARELEEEIGVSARHLEKLAEFFTTPGFCEEKLWVYLATGLIETEQNLEGDEMLEIVRVSFSRAFEMIADGEIEDAKTIIGLLMAQERLGLRSGGAEYPAV